LIQFSDIFRLAHAAGVCNFAVAAAGAGSGEVNGLFLGGDLLCSSIIAAAVVFPVSVSF